MTAGNVDLAYRPESAYRESDDTASWIQVGRGATVTELSLDNQLEALRDPNNPVPVDQLEGNYEGALNISLNLTGDPTPVWHDLVFQDGALPSSGGRAPSAEWAIGLDYIGGTIEWLTQGTVVTEASLTWNNGQSWTVDLTMLFGDDDDNESFTPADVQTMSPSKVYNHAATTLDADAVEVQGMQSFTLSLSNLAQLRPGNGRHPYEAEIGPVSASVEMQADYTEESTTHFDMARGDSTQQVEEIGTAPLSIQATNKDGDQLGYTIDAAKPATYGWEELTEGESAEQESITWNIYRDGNNGVSVA